MDLYDMPPSKTVSIKESEYLQGENTEVEKEPVRTPLYNAH